MKEKEIFEIMKSMSNKDRSNILHTGGELGG